MKLENLQDQWKKDCDIDRSELGEESLKVAQLHSFYYKHFSEERLLLRKLEIDYKKLLKFKFEYYNGLTPPEVLKKMNLEPFSLKVLKSDLNYYLESDDHIAELQLKIDYQKEKVTFLDSIIKQLNGRSWEIKNAIEWNKFINGM
jgi:hypothetical protein